MGPRHLGGLEFLTGVAIVALAGIDDAWEAPFVVDERVDEETLVGIGRAVEFVVFGGEFGEIFGGFGSALAGF
jgi:hypothetical protein